MNVAQLHVALHRFGCSDLLRPLQSAHICCKVRKPTFRYVLQTGAYNRLLRGKCGTWTLNRKAPLKNVGNAGRVQAAGQSSLHQLWFLFTLPTSALLTYFYHTSGLFGRNE